MLPVLFCMSDSVRRGSFFATYFVLFVLFVFEFLKECKFHVHFLRPVFKKNHNYVCALAEHANVKFYFHFLGRCVWKRHITAI